MNVVDSSAWLEYFAGGPNAAEFRAAIHAVDRLVVPTVTIYEVFRRVSAQRGNSAAFEAVAVMGQGRLAPLDGDLAIEAADIGLQHSLPMADSIILATTRRYDATLWTQDADFEGLVGVEFRAAR